MAAKAGEIARETTMYSCEGCRRPLPVHEGTPIPNCPGCGSHTFQTGVRSLRNEPAIAAPLGFANFP